MTLGEIQKMLRTPDNAQRIRDITTPDAIAWPTVSLMIVCLSIFAAVTTAGLTGTLPLWLAAIINGLNGYLIFSVVHDSIHRTLSSNQNVNDWLGQISLIPFAPMVSLSLFRWGHIQHHRFASGPKDPDKWCFEGPKALLPLRWMFIDVWYFLFSVKAGDATANKYLKPTLAATLATLTIFGAFIAYGYFWEIFFLWFVPSRITQIMLGFSFFWLPHEPHDTPQEDNFTRATTIRKGWEWLLNPVLQYQNYHLVHHLFPRTPFYRNLEMYELLEPELQKHDLAIQHDFAIKPEIYPGSQPAR